MSLRPDSLSIVESCYAPASEHSEWLQRVLEQASAAFDFGAGVALTLFEEQDGRPKVKLSQGLGPVSRGLQLSWPLLESMSGESYRRFFYPKRAVTLSSPIVAGFSMPLQVGYKAVLAFMGSRDLLGLLGYPAPGLIFSMYFGLRRQREVSPRVRAALHRVRIHVESGLRLRLCPQSEAAAVLTPEGKVLHLAAPAQALPERLRDGVRTVEHSRTRQQRTREGALDVWTALVEGRWSLVERVDSDGQRHYLAFENAPFTRAYRALTPSEAAVLDHSIQGLPGKYVAYATGLAESRVSSCLSMSAAKLGFRNRAELIRVASGLRSYGQYDLLDAGLTEAELEILQLLRDGRSNREIAVARGSSEKTVANQVASILRKTKTSGRRGLLVASMEPSELTE
jgi:DNA-binding NarL/FixJ family response regulator